MPRLLKGCGILFAAAVGLIILLLIASQVLADSRLRRQYDVEAEQVTIPSDEAAIERGRKLVTTGRCAECHGGRLGGKVSFDDPSVGQIYASNLTTGEGGVGRTYTDADWVRAIRHGIGPDGRSLVITPAQYYYHLSDEDLGAIIAYIKSRPPVDNELPQPSVGPLGKLFLALFNPSDWLPAEKIDHTSPRPTTPAPGVNAQYGRYLVQTSTCLVCHGQLELSAAPGGALAGWTEADFMRAMRIGFVPNGNRIESSSLKSIVSQMSDDELKAMWLHLQSLPPVNDD